ncbi:MAG: carboxypeptidase regulatory-like domain-containing protein, partial [Deltaproteobacteria bacterium]
PASGGTCNDANEACGPGTCGGEGGTMLPGSNCMACHDGSGGGEEEAPRFGVAGTVFTDIDGGGEARNATVFVTDSTGQSVTLTTNSVGNFYTTRQLTPPLTAEVEADGFTAAMTSEVSTGACNSCHQCDGAAGGKLYTQ